MAPRHDAGRAVLAREVDEHDHRRDLHLGVRARHVAPDDLVAVQPLLVGARTALEQVPEVQLVAGARREQHPVAELEQQRLAHHVDGERRRDARDAADLLGVRPVERGEHRVEQLGLGIGGVDRGLDLVVHPRHDVGGDQILDDHCARGVERSVHRVGVGIACETLDRR